MLVERGPARFLVCAAAIAAHHPAIVDKVVAEFALQALALAKGRLYTRGTVLELVSQVLTAGLEGGGWPPEDAVVGLGRGPLGTLLTARVSGRRRGRLVQFVALGLLAGLLPHIGLPELAYWFAPQQLPRLFLQHPSSHCRGRFFEVAIAAWGLVGGAAPSGGRAAAVSSSTASVALREALRGSLLAGLFDAAPAVRARIYAFWSDPSRLDSGVSRRVLQLMTGMLDVTDIGARSWLHHAAPLVLGLAQDHAAENGSRTAIFAHPLDREARFQALAVGREWNAAAGSAALRPLFSQAARADAPDGTMDGGAGKVLATQNLALAPRFSATIAGPEGAGGARRPLAASFAPQVASFGTFVAAMEAKRRTSLARVATAHASVAAGVMLLRASAQPSLSFAAVATQFMKAGGSGGRGLPGRASASTQTGSSSLASHAETAGGGAGHATAAPGDGRGAAVPMASAIVAAPARALPASSQAPVPSFRVSALRALGGGAASSGARSGGGASYFKMAAYRAQTLRAVADAQNRNGALSAVRLTRSYRQGELPDVQVAPLDVVRSLQQLCELVSWRLVRSLPS